ncbi:MAG: helix-turn-helix domain-containing protein [Cyanobacteria bacterium P01_A01_bin.40]
MYLKSRITELRKIAGLSQAQLAVFVGVSTNTIQSWEKPDGLAQLEKYLKLAEVLGAKRIIDLFKRVEEEDQNYKSKTNKSNRRQFSLDDLRKLREDWGIDESGEETFNEDNQNLVKTTVKNKNSDKAQTTHS